MNTNDKFLDKIKFVKDFPKQGINFVDYSDIFSNEKSLIQLQIYIMKLLKNKESPDYVVGIESRGFSFAAMISFIYNIPLVFARKAGKLPNKVKSINYDTEYSNTSIEMQNKDIKKNKKYLIVDDVLATGGTLNAVKNLIEKNKGIVLNSFVFIDINLKNCEYDKKKLIKIIDV